MPPLSWCLASSHLPVLAGSNGTGCFGPLGAAIERPNGLFFLSFSAAAAASVPRRDLSPLSIREKGRPPPNYLLQ